MRIAHRLNLSTTATMVYGHIETIEERLQHIITIRDLQKERPEGSPGFRAFICWPMQIKGTKLSEIYQKKSEHFNKDRLFKGNEVSEQSAEFLRTIAISRIILNNIDHIQASWLTVGIDAGKLSLYAGADDMGSIMIEENVVSATGSHNSLNAKQMQSTICDAGFEPWLRDQQYSEIKNYSPPQPYIRNL
jgi:cyclic dehypoxanthinyl futalosine synthase